MECFHDQTCRPTTTQKVSYELSIPPILGTVMISQGQCKSRYLPFGVGVVSPICKSRFEAVVVEPDVFGCWGTDSSSSAATHESELKC